MPNVLRGYSSMNSDLTIVRGYGEHKIGLREYWKYRLCQQVRTERYREMGYSVNELCYNVSDLNELIRTCVDMIFWSSTIRNFLNQDGIFMSWCIWKLSWYFLGIPILHIVSIEGVFSCLDREGIFMSRSRGYFHVSIERVFSCLDRAGISMAGSILKLQKIIQCDWKGTWPLFGQVKLFYDDGVYHLYYGHDRWTIRIAQRKYEYVEETVINIEYSDNKFRGRNFYKKGRIVTSPTQKP